MDTIPNIVVPPQTPIDLYAGSGITVGTQINVAMIGNGTARLVATAALATAPDNSTGYRNIEAGEEYVNDGGDVGAWIWSGAGCIVNVKAVI